MSFVAVAGIGLSVLGGGIKAISGGRQRKKAIRDAMKEKKKLNCKLN